MFSLCIPTMDRFDKFLVRYLPQYLENPYIDEIIITDENGNDVDKISSVFPNNSKLKLIKNESRLGAFANKLKACSFAKNEWIALIDSDNFADNTYFATALKYIENKLEEGKNVILSPCNAKPSFNFKHFSGHVLKKGNFAEFRKLGTNLITLCNTGNYIINKNLVSNFDINRVKNINHTNSCDVIYFNSILFENYDLHFHVVPDMEYEHVVHDDSIYLQTHELHRDFANKVIHKFDTMQ